MDASFVSASDGWLIGVTLRHCWQYGGSRLVVRETTDGGRHWSPVSAPPAPVPWSGGAQIPPAASVSEIYFASARDGWAFGPGLWATHDGGASWHRVGTHGRGVYSLAASGGHVVGAFDSCGADCGRGAASSFTIATAPIGSDAWRPVPGAAGEGKGQPQVTAAGGTAYALTAGDAGNPSTRARLLSGPADGTAPWHARTTPCYAMGANTVTAVTAARLVMACALLGAHPATTRFYRTVSRTTGYRTTGDRTTGDHGAHWRQFSSLGLYDGASCVSVTGDGTLLAAGNYDGVAMSYDGGRGWHRPSTVDASPQVGGGGEIVAAMTADRDGFAIAPWGPVWITRDGGHTWTPVIVR